MKQPMNPLYLLNINQLTLLFLYALWMVFNIFTVPRSVKLDLPTINCLNWPCVFLCFLQKRKEMNALLKTFSW